MEKNSRVVKANIPPRVIATAVFIGVAVFGFIVFAVWQSGTRIADAKMTGVITAKEFRPLAEAENQVTLNRSGAVSSKTVEGEYILTVEVPQKDGSKRVLNVWLNDKARYDAVKVGDSYDCGPAYVPSK
jgi:hypothetical protein